MSESIAWKWESPPLTCGILACCDANQEWLLPWWWERLSSVGDYPVAFVDLGMSAEGRAFCEKHAMLLPLQEKPRVALRDEVDPQLVEVWERGYGESLWAARPAWFMKPFALLETPFENTLYLDLDCEVVKPIDQLLQPFTDDVVVSTEPYDVHVSHAVNPDLPMLHRFYNSGVVRYRHGAPLIKQWAEMTHRENHRFSGDDKLLSYLLSMGDFSVGELPHRFHVRVVRDVPLDAAIIHLVGTWGKQVIRKRGGLKDLVLSALPVRDLEARLWHVEEKR